MSYKYNPLLKVGLDEAGSGAGGGNPGGSDTQVQFNDGGSAFGGDTGLTFNKTTNTLTVGVDNADPGTAVVKGDINLDDGGSWTTTLQTITPSQDNTISLPNATGTVALVAGSSGQLLWNNAGANAGASTLTYDGSILTTSGRFINSYNATASSPAKAFTGTWFTGGTATTTKPQVLIEPTGTTSTAWSTSGTGLGVNAASGFAGNLLDLQVNGTGVAFIDQTGLISSRAVGGNGGGAIFGGVVISGARAYVGQYGLRLFENLAVSWSATTNLNSLDLLLFRDAAGTLAQRNGTNAQTYRLYNTYTDASNYERAYLRWASNVLEIGTEGAGTGSEKPVRITAATLKLPNLPTYVDNAAATTGGLVAGDVYKTATGELRITV